ncbi:MAG: D-glycero-beta-D-manno-heptose-7-phosphate kinase [Mesorhizobium sp.]|nr:D-glycero-beta-D-manno-heptose-7-phosphate kinase [Mesorhizobium sp.]MCO5162766.1 D-glycero-beta-D-manno-heptose-7-phosphate kinase [Mesorhizobium sp.]
MSETSLPSIETVHRVLGRLGEVRVLVAGDFILDRFVNGVIERISPEAPIPVLHGRNATQALGGAGNVVANIVSLGGKASAVSAVGDDPAGHAVRSMLADLGVDTAGLVSSRSRMTSCKSRFIAMNQQVLRFDEEEVAPLDAATRAGLLARFETAVGETDIVILSDYGKGVLTDGMAANLIAIAKAAGKPVLVDPKSRDFGHYAGATAVTPNRKELGEAVGRAVMSDGEIEAATRELIAAHGFDFILATRSEKGMSVVEAEDARHIATQAREVFDVSGAGDTVIATFALALGAGAHRSVAAQIANAAAGVVVAKRGTASLTVEELSGALSRASGPVRHIDAVLDFAGAERLVGAWKREGLTVGFTNGCFDILHAGHVTLLHAARSQCDRLVLGLNSDASVRRLKGEGRPVNAEHDRACVLAALASVDAVVVFSEDTPLRLIELLKPDVLVKGADYTIDKVVGADIVQAYGGKVLLVDLVEGRSTTATIRKLKGQ